MSSVSAVALTSSVQLPHERDPLRLYTTLPVSVEELFDIRDLSCHPNSGGHHENMPVVTHLAGESPAADRGWPIGTVYPGQALLAGLQPPEELPCEAHDGLLLIQFVNALETCKLIYCQISAYNKGAHSVCGYGATAGLLLPVVFDDH